MGCLLWDLHFFGLFGPEIIYRDKLLRRARTHAHTHTHTHTHAPRKPHTHHSQFLEHYFKALSKSSAVLSKVKRGFRRYILINSAPNILHQISLLIFNHRDHVADNPSPFRTHAHAHTHTRMHTHTHTHHCFPWFARLGEPPFPPKRLHSVAAVDSADGVCLWEQPLVMHDGRLYKQHVRRVHQTSLAFPTCRPSATLTFWQSKAHQETLALRESTPLNPAVLSISRLTGILAFPEPLTFPVRTRQLAVYILIDIKLCQRTTEGRWEWEC